MEILFRKIVLLWHHEKEDVLCERSTRSVLAPQSRALSAATVQPAIAAILLKRLRILKSKTCKAGFWLF
jgi:hypothetical protein